MAGYGNFQTKKRRKASPNSFSNEVNQGVQKKEKLSKNERLMNGVKTWASYYRKRPDKMAEDWGIHLKPFQRYVLCEMMNNNYIAFIASRGLSKTFLTSLYAIIRCILFPDTKVVVAASVKAQAMKIVTEKLDELIGMAPMIKREILDTSTNMNSDTPNVRFKNGSSIKVVASNDNARSGHCNCLILDEFRMIDPKIYQSVLRRFLAASRHPKYMDKPEYQNQKLYPMERNQEIFLTSAYYKNNWSYDKYKVFLQRMLEGKKYKVYAYPYQMAIKERITNKEQLLDEMSENDRDPVIWGMEMDTLFFGQAESAFFNFEQLEATRTANPPIYPKYYYDLLKTNKFKAPQKKEKEIRCLCVDIATIAGKQNDASAFYLMQLFPDKKGYSRRFSYGETMTGGHTVTQALKIKQLFYDLDCDYLVLDRQNAGIGVYDQLIIPMYDKERGIDYEPWVSMNDEEMKSRCPYDDAKSIIFTIAASASLNDEIARNMRDVIIRKRIQFLGNRDDMYDYFESFQEFFTSQKETQVRFEIPFAETDALMNEMILLEQDITNSGGRDLIKLKTTGRNRKDRYSAVSYGNYFATTLEKDLLKPEDNTSMIDYFRMVNGNTQGINL
ncbi:MAG: hypothetical protein RRZ31_14010, partial [Chryseobacterium sp.]